MNISVWQKIINYCIDNDIDVYTMYDHLFINFGQIEIYKSGRCEYTIEVHNDKGEIVEQLPFTPSMYREVFKKIRKVVLKNDQ